MLKPIFNPIAVFSKVAIVSIAISCFFVSGAHGQQGAAPDLRPDGQIPFRSPTPEISSADGTLPPASGATGNQPQTAASAPSPSPTPQQTPDGQIPFHSPTPDMNSGESSLQPLNGATGGEPQKEMSSLTDQKDTLETELRYARSKLDAASKRLDSEASEGQPEQYDKSEQEVKDWDARVKALEGQLTQLDSEVQGANQEMEIPSLENDLILPGDNLEVFVVEDSSFNGHYQVRRGGYIIVPAVGRIPVAGKTMPGAEAEVRKALETTQLQHATVIVEKVEGADVESGPNIFLAGAFKNQHPFRIPPGTKPTVVNLILSCGGVTPSADLSRVLVMRIVANKSVVEQVNVANILGGSGLTSDLTLSDGDVVVVPGGPSNNIFVSGCVNRPGSQWLQPGLTVFSAILDSGGFARFADTKKVYVLRASPDGTKVRIPVNINAIEHGHTLDLPLQGNDVIIVPEKFFSF